MKKNTIIVIILFISCIQAFCQEVDTANMVTITVKKSRLPLRCIYSHSNTIYANVTNILAINYPDSAVGNYEIETELGYIHNMKRGKFMVVKHNPGGLTVTVWKDSSNGTRKMVGSQEFTVMRLPNASITVEGNIVDTTVSITSLLQNPELGLVFGDFTPMDDICSIKSFDIKIGSQEYHSESNTMTYDMLNAIVKAKGTMLFENVQAYVNSGDNMDQTLSKDKKQRLLTEKFYLVEKESKPIQLMR